MTTLNLVPTGTLRDDNRALPPVPADVRPTYWMFHNARWHNITGFIRSATWRHGQPIVNRVGGVATPANGNLIIDDLEGYFNVFNPNTNINPLPGARIRIVDGREVTDASLFEGYSRGVQNLSLIHI